MPLRVHCPSGCLIRLPTNRAGKVVRCPQCKLVVRIPSVSRTELASGKPIPIKAKLVETSEPETPENAQPIESEPADDEAISSAAIEHAKKLKPKKATDQPVLPDKRERLELPTFSRPTAPESLVAQSSLDSDEFESIPFPSIDTRNGAAANNGANPDTNEDRDNDISPDERNTQRLMDRVLRAKKEKVYLARFLAFVLIGVAVFNLVPSIYHWYQWSTQNSPQSLPRWTYLLIFAASIHIIYAVYLAQVPDWTSMFTVAIVLLVFAAIFGAISTGLALGSSEGVVARYLNLPHVMVRNACIWCVAMLLLATLTSYIIGREARNWQRVELLMNQILVQKGNASDPAAMA